MRTPPGRRGDRARGALHAVGTSVVSGASTTVGANLFLLGCTVTFFFKFGLFIAVTLSASLVHAIVVFPAVCAAFGPEGRAGRGGPLGLFSSPLVVVQFNDASLVHNLSLSFTPRLNPPPPILQPSCFEPFTTN